ncbi:DHA2 family efflux MFS transporter permease subunit [Sinimarinibacterium sp. CAU 1509]|uniref:DHA2 family efflux MFS transporter permease subunit n=1 Tax=Sinimarinibacterium sp. CAU 1509 TaxID=2562283 RepID=UPI0024A96BA0|nr:DHA2 family efflux MFS transporter permease subunit [Sinimarinibacterium sp. CAU 1509]
MMAATLMQVLDTTIANVALPHMRGALSAATDQITWVLTSYMVACAIATAPTGYLANRFGRKRVFIIAVIGFTIASILCGMATSLPEMVTFRILQGLFGACLVPLSQAVMLDSYPPQQHGQAMALWGMGVMIGPILGPVLGGWLTEYYNWRWVFYINVPIGILSVLGLMAALPPDRESTAKPLDVGGFVALSVAIAALQLMLDRGETLDWFSSPEIIAEAFVAILALYLFVAHSMTTARPFVSPVLFADRNFTAGLVMISVVGVVLFATSALLPPFLQNLRNVPATTTGLALAPRGVGTMIAMHVVGKIIGRIDARPLMLAGLILTAYSLYWMAEFSLDVPITTLMLAGVVQGAGLGLVFVPLSTITFATLHAEHRGEATALFSLLRNVGSSVGIALAFAYQSRMLQHNHAQLVEHVNPFNPALAEYANAAGGLGSAAGLAQLMTDVQQQSAMLALIADFKAMMIGVLLAIPLLLLFRKAATTDNGQATTQIAHD